MIAYAVYNTLCAWLYFRTYLNRNIHVGPTCRRTSRCNWWRADDHNANHRDKTK